jgi:hypothetical protein
MNKNPIYAYVPFVVILEDMMPSVPPRRHHLLILLHLEVVLLPEEEEAVMVVHVYFRLITAFLCSELPQGRDSLIV